MYKYREIFIPFFQILIYKLFVYWSLFATCSIGINHESDYEISHLASTKRYHVFGAEFNGVTDSTQHVVTTRHVVNTKLLMSTGAAFFSIGAGYANLLQPF